MQSRKKILITGSTGFIGGAIAHRWAALGLGSLGDVHVAALVRDPGTERAHQLQEAGIELISGDLSRTETFRQALQGIDLVIHAAGETTLTRPKQVWRIAVEATRQLYEAAAEAGVGHFIMVSSMSTYGGLPVLAGEITHPASFGDPYSDTKVAAERSLLAAAGPDCPEVTILRLAAVYGPGSTRWTKRPIQQALQNQLSMPGAGEFQFPYLYVENMVDAVTAAASAGQAGIYDIFDGVTPYRDFMNHYAQMAGTRLNQVPIGILTAITALSEWVGWVTGRYPQLNRPALRAMLRPVENDHPLPEKARQELCWIPRFSLAEGMAEIERRNGFHKHTFKEADPWQQSDGWVDEEI